MSTRIRERLDRFLCTSSWFDLFSNYTVEHLLRYKFDHVPIITRAKVESGNRRKQRGFRFETCWLLDEGCEDVVRQAWEGSNGEGVISRISSMAHRLTSWSSVHCSKLGNQIKKVEKALFVAQQKRTTEESCLECAELEKKLDRLNEKHEAYWFLRSRVAEIKDGDKNTQYFHHKALQRRKRNYVKGLADNNDVWCPKDDELENIFATYFSNIFTSSKPSDLNVQDVLQCIDSVVTDECNHALMKPYTKDEIYAALQQMHPCKAPGPDRMHAVFYQRFWHIIGDGISHFVCNILHGGRFPEELNHTNIALIPKVKEPKIAAEFRPIALCNVIYKLISKVL